MEHLFPHDEDLVPLSPCVNSGRQLGRLRNDGGNHGVCVSYSDNSNLWAAAFADRFPYDIMYLVEPNYVWIVAVMDLHSEPGYGRERLG
jgi:hypothetical protein